MKITHLFGSPTVCSSGAKTSPISAQMTVSLWRISVSNEHYLCVCTDRCNMPTVYCEMCPSTLCNQVVVGLVIGDISRFSSNYIQTEWTAYCEMLVQQMTKWVLTSKCHLLMNIPVVACHIHSVHGKCFMMIDDDRSLSHQSCGRYSALSSVVCLLLSPFV